MKSRVLALFVTAALFAMNACKSDPCKDVECLNGSTCNEGVCDCLPGYSGTFCADYDSCHDVTCENGGVCVGGTCDCPEGYEGSDCSELSVPSAMVVSEVRLTSYPDNDAGVAWDFAGRPDIYFEINVGASQLYKHHSPKFDVGPSEIVTYSGMVLEFTDVTSTHTFKIYDQDTPDPDQEMGSVDFTPWDDGNKEMPSTLEFVSNDIAFEIDVTLRYD